MTWWRGNDRYEVYFNRDELKTRSRALPPEVRSTSQGVRYIAPTDPDAGGTWMLVNELGVTVCLLNRWHESSAVKNAGQSRGRLVLSFAGAKSACEVIDQLRDTQSNEYKPFTLVAIDHQDLLVEAWNGEQLLIESAEAPLTSSSYCFHEVKESRCEAYRQLANTDSESLGKYQAGLADQAGESHQSAFTVRMNRPDAQTWSRSHLIVGGEGTTWQYLEELPDLVGESIEHNVELKREP